MFKKLPSTEPNKKYVLRVEGLTVPETTSGLILNKALFEVKRRLIVGRDVILRNANLPIIEGVGLDDGAMTFTPDNVRS